MLLGMIAASSMYNQLTDLPRMADAVVAADSTLLLFSNSTYERESYEKKLIINNNCSFFHSGNPKHDIAWISNILSFSRQDYKKNFGNYVFLISRPALRDYLPLDRKKKSLES